MKFFYDPSLRIPNVANDKSEATHSHSCSVNYSKDADKVMVKQGIQSEIRSIENCIKFFETFKTDPSLSVKEQAEIAASVQVDKDYIKDLQKITPSSCSIS
jgi:hypothetical protein